MERDIAHACTDSSLKEFSGLTLRKGPKMHGKFTICRKSDTVGTAAGHFGYFVLEFGILEHVGTSGF